MGAALPEDIGHDFSYLRRAFDEKHPDAIESWRPGPDIRCVVTGRSRGITVRLHNPQSSGPDLGHQLDFGPIRGREAAPGSSGCAFWYHRGMLITLGAAINGGWLKARP
jgi:hypothetical protein